MNFKERKIDKLKMWPKVVGTFSPLIGLEPEKMKLKDFIWLDKLRPLNKDDIFRKTVREQKASRKVSTRFNED